MIDVIPHAIQYQFNINSNWKYVYVYVVSNGDFDNG